MDFPSIAKKCGNAVALLLTIWACAIPIAAVASNRVALVIGNGDYGAAFGHLSSPMQDAQAIAKKLEVMNFQLVGDAAHIDVTKKRLAELLGDLRVMVDKQSNSIQQRPPSTPITLFYYSGHGVSYDGDSWLIPVSDDESTESINFREDLNLHAIGIKTTFNYLSPHDEVLNMVILDACRDNKLRSRNPGLTKGAQTPKGLLRPEKPGNVTIVFAAEQGKVAYADSAGGLSPFTEALVKHIDRPGVDITSMLVDVASDVMNTTNQLQQPSIGEQKLAGLKLHKVYFVPCDAEDEKCSGNTTIETDETDEIDKHLLVTEHDKAYDRATERDTILDYFSVIEHHPNTSSATNAAADIRRLTPRHFSKPPVASGRVLGVAEIKWCLRQIQWLMSFRRTAQANSVALDTYNDINRDYKRRCQSSLQSATNLRIAENWIDHHQHWIADTMPNW